MSYYEKFLEARDCVLAVYPDAVCKWTTGSFKVFENSETESFMHIIGSSYSNEPCAWFAAADWVQNDFLNELEK